MIEQRGLLVAMIAAVSLVVGVLILDEQQEFEAAVANLKNEQVTLATAVGADFETRLQRLEQQRDSSHPDVARIERIIPELLGGAMRLEQRGSRILLVARPDEDRLLTTSGQRVWSKVLSAALRNGASAAVLSRDDAVRFGLPRRIALAGIETVDAPSGSWGVVVLASAERLRAREHYAQLRFVLGLGLVTAIVSGFGGMAFRQQRRKLEIARALEVSALQQDREKLLAKADKMATLAVLSSGIAHEVATPLGTIMARVEQLLPSNAHDARATAALNTVLTQVQRIQTIIQGMLGLARGQMPSRALATPQSIASNAVTLALHRFKQAGVHVTLDVSPDLEEIACDPPMLEQALTNLLLNACDASLRGSTVVVRAHAHDSSLCFEVLDDGEGITPEVAARVNEPFFTTKAPGRGTGLGLAIVREVTSHHGGQLRLEPGPSARGTRAIIELPRV